MFDDLLKYTSDFQDDVEGWSTINPVDGFQHQFDFVFAGFFDGNIVGLSSSHPSTGFFSAPDEFLGDKSEFYGGELSFRQAELPNGDPTDDAYDVILLSGTTLIGFDLPSPTAANSLQTLSFEPSNTVRIIPNPGPGLNISAETSASHAQATEAQIRIVLADLDALYIRAEYTENGAVVIDDVQIDASDSPVIRVEIFDSPVSLSSVAAAGTLHTALQIAQEGQTVRMDTYVTAGEGWSPFFTGSMFTGTIRTDDLTLDGPSQLIAKLFLGEGVGDFTITGATALAEILGNDLNNRIQGSDQRNVIYGGDGTDILTGGAANDDLFGGDDGDAIYGNGGVDKIYGDGGADALFGGAAADEVYGGDENDTIHGDGGADELWGDGGNDEIYGGTENDEIYGGDGEDQLDGGVGADTMFGGRDNDTYVVDDSADQVIESEDRGDDIVYSSVSYDVPLNVEVLILSGSANLNATGTDSRDQIFGNAGENIINGAGGFDVMQGGAGNDTYAVDNSLDAVIEAAGGGFDNVYSSVDYALDAAQEIESAILTGTATVLRGDDSDNQLFGNDHVNVIDGRGGTDFMLGLGGADIFQINLEAGAQDIVGDFSKAQGDRLAFTGFDQANTFVNQASATSFEVRDTKGTADLADDTVQTFILNDSYGSGTYTQGALEFGVDYYFG